MGFLSNLWSGLAGFAVGEVKPAIPPQETNEGFARSPANDPASQDFIGPPSPTSGGDKQRGGSGGLRFAGPATNPRQTPEKELVHKAAVIFGETAGVYPRLKPGARDVYNPDSWDNDSTLELNEARRKIAVVSERNRVVHTQMPNLKNFLEKRAWQYSKDAARLAQDEDLPADVYHFFLRQEGKGLQKPAREQWGKVERYESHGPFINTGGGDAPRGNRLFIDFYRREK